VVYVLSRQGAQAAGVLCQLQAFPPHRVSACMRWLLPLPPSPPPPQPSAAWFSVGR
jgi:hypothetical protein